MKILTTIQHETGPRRYIGPQRLHHGSVAALAAAVLLSNRRTRMLALPALLIAADDIQDFRYWFAPGDPQRDLPGHKTIIHRLTHR